MSFSAIRAISFDLAAVGYCYGPAPKLQQTAASLAKQVSFFTLSRNKPPLPMGNPLFTATASHSNG
jgi:hypothetical protein